MTSLTCSSKQIERIRAVWLISFFATIVWGLFYSCLKVHSHSNIMLDGKPAPLIIDVIAVILVHLLFYIPFYYFAYKKRGTRFLGVVIIITLLTIACDIGGFFKVPIPHLPEINNWTPFNILFLLYFFITSYRLYRANKEYHLKALICGMFPNMNDSNDNDERLVDTFPYDQEQSERIRKRWLISFIVLFVVSILEFSITLITLGWHWVVLGLPLIKIGSPLFLLFFGAPLYYFAYKKRGSIFYRICNHKDII